MSAQQMVNYVFIFSKIRKQQMSMQLILLSQTALNCAEI